MLSTCQDLFLTLAVKGHNHAHSHGISAKGLKALSSKANINFYLAFLGVAIATIVLLVMVWKASFTEDDEETRRAASFWTVAFFFIGLMFFVAGIFTFQIYETYNYLAAVLHGLGVGSMVGVFLVGSYSIGETVTGKSFAFNIFSIVRVIAVLAVIVAVNYRVYRSPKKFEFNKDKIETLDDATIKVLKGLTKRVEVIGFLYEHQKSWDSRIRTILQKYRNQNMKHFHFRIVNPQRDLDLVNCYGVKPSQASRKVRTPLIVSQGRCVRDKRSKRWKFVGKKAAVARLSENDITNKLIKVTRASSKEICFLTGRDQPSIKARKRSGRSFYFLNQTLKDKSYKTRSIDLLTTTKVPSSCDVVIHASTLNRPNNTDSNVMYTGGQLVKSEVDQLKEYLAKGGKVMIFQEPYVKSGLETLIASYGIEQMPGYVTDFAQSRRSPLVFYTSAFGSHVTTQGLNKRALSYLMTSGALNFKRIKGTKNVPLLMSTRLTLPRRLGVKKPCCSFLVPNISDPMFLSLIKRLSMVKRPVMLLNIGRGILEKIVKGVKRGPFVLAATAARKVKGTKKEARLVVFADSNFATNLFGAPGNKALVLNSINWLAQERDLIAKISRKRRSSSFVRLNSKQNNLVRLTTRFGMPLFFFFVILFVMAIRRTK